MYSANKSLILILQKVFAFSHIYQYLPPTINSKTKPILFVDGISIIISYP